MNWVNTADSAHKIALSQLLPAEMDSVIPTKINYNAQKTALSIFVAMASVMQVNKMVFALRTALLVQTDVVIVSVTSMKPLPIAQETAQPLTAEMVFVMKLNTLDSASIANQFQSFAETINVI